MTIPQALVAFCIAAGLLTIVPGLDTALVLRTAAAEGAKDAALAGLGIAMGCVTWGAAVALGLGALLAASELAFTALKWAGALYLVWLGVNLILKPRSRFALELAEEAPARAAAAGCDAVTSPTSSIPRSVFSTFPSCRSSCRRTYMRVPSFSSSPYCMRRWASCGLDC